MTKDKKHLASLSVYGVKPEIRKRLKEVAEDTDRSESYIVCKLLKDWYSKNKK